MKIETILWILVFLNLVFNIVLLNAAAICGWASALLYLTILYKLECEKEGKEMEIITFFREWYWFHLQLRCPKCHEKLIKAGYPKDFKQYYKCLKCKWGDE